MGLIKTGVATSPFPSHWCTRVLHPYAHRHAHHSCGRYLIAWASCLGILLFPTVAASELFQLATGSYDKSVKLWDALTGNCTATLTGHTDSVYSVAYKPR